MTETIRDQIADLTYFEEKPDIYAYGMLCSMLATGIWLVGCVRMRSAACSWRTRPAWCSMQQLTCLPLPLPPPHSSPPSQLAATYWELPVSTTHAVVGAVVGMTMVSAGPAAVNWSEHTDTFPFLGVRRLLARGSGCRHYRWPLSRLFSRGLARSHSRPPCPPLPHSQGVSSILLSWLFSPILTCLLALVTFLALRTWVLRSPHAYRRAYYVLPIFVMATFFM